MVCRNLEIKANKNYLGSIPDNFGELKALTILDLSNNSFSGTLLLILHISFISCYIYFILGPIPLSLSQLNNTTEFWLEGNRLTGNVDSSLEPVLVHVCFFIIYFLLWSPFHFLFFFFSFHGRHQTFQMDADWEGIFSIVQVSIPSFHFIITF
jgi:hypothetical protein